MCKNLAALLLLFATIPASARDSTEHWFELQSPHFVVLTDSNEKQARRIASQFERMRAVFHTLFPTATADAGSPIVVVALKDKKDFQALEPAAYLAKGQLDLAGLFLRAPDKNYVLLRLDAQGEHPFATVYHEYTHLMLSKAEEWLPLWLNEGLAEFYQNTDIQDKDVLLGQPSPDDILYLRQNRLLPLTTLFKVDHASPYYHEEQKGSIFYAESWALTHYLEVTDREKSTDRLGDYVKLVSQHQDPVTAAQNAFGDLNQLQKALEAYIGQGSFKLFKMNSAVTFDESSLQVRPVSASEADSVRADVLVYSDRIKDAQALLDATLRDDPNNALAHESMGYLKFREGDFAAAKKWYGEAVQLDSHSYLAHYYFAAMCLNEGDTSHDEAIESSLRTAIKLNPSFAPAYDSLAMLYGSRHMKLGEAHLLNAQAILLEPDNLNFRLNAANVLMEQEQFASAINVLKLAAHVAKTPAETALVQSRLDQVEQFQSSIDRARSANAEAMTQASVVTSSNSRVVVTTEPAPPAGPKYPTEAPSGPRHTAKGILRSVQCSYPSVITLGIEQGGKTVSLYSNNYYKIDFSATNYTPASNFNPCKGMEGMRALVEYAEVSDKTIAGQILSIELTK